jgi:hypothetical protein
MSTEPAPGEVESLARQMAAKEGYTGDELVMVETIAGMFTEHLWRTYAAEAWKQLTEQAA